MQGDCASGFADDVAFVCEVADKLRGTFEQHEYGSVMLWCYAAWTPCSRQPGTPSCKGSKDQRHRVTARRSF